MVNPLPIHKAQQYALEMQQQFDQHRALDYHTNKELSLDHLFEDEKGQMFGVLVCEDDQKNEIVLYAFSGQFQKRWSVEGYVGPAFDEDEFNRLWDESKLTFMEYEKEIHHLEKEQGEALSKRKVLSQTLQRELHSLYEFHSIDQKTYSLKDIFNTLSVPSGTGDCCAIKLFNEAFKRKLHPVSLAEFYYGHSSCHNHKEFYPPCDRRCKDLITTMLGLEILYLDDSIVVVNKPPRLLAVPGRGEDKQDSISYRVKRLFRFSIDQPAVHRLDMDTSGLMVLCFSSEAHRNLSIQFSSRRVEKEYVALVEGIITQERGEITLAFRYDPENKPRQIYDPVLGKWGTTKWEKVRVERRGARHVTRLLLRPIEGRTHQLRLHTSDPRGLGTPIVGDRLYGEAGDEKRMALHASRLSFHHPVTDELLTFEVESEF